MCFLRRWVVSTSPNPQSGGPPLVGCPRLLIQFIHSYPPYRRPFLHPQPEDAPCRGNRDPHPWGSLHYTKKMCEKGTEIEYQWQCWWTESGTSNQALTASKRLQEVGIISPGNRVLTTVHQGTPPTPPKKPSVEQRASWKATRAIPLSCSVGQSQYWEATVPVDTVTCQHTWIIMMTVVPIFKNVPALYGIKRFLGAFLELRKVTINFVIFGCLFVSPSNSTEKLGSY